MKRTWKRRTREAEVIEPADPRLIGYARVSTREQTLDLQIDALAAAGVRSENLHVEKVSGVSAKRPKLKLALLDCRPGDTFLVWRVDRLGRSVEDLYRRVRELQEQGVGFKSLKDGLDLSTAVGKLMFGMLAIMAEFERNMTIERTQAGMRAARDRGHMPGRAPKMTDERLDEAEKLLGTMTVREVAKRFRVQPATIYSYFSSKDLERLRARKR